MKQAAAVIIFVGAVFALIFMYTSQMEQEAAKKMEDIPKEDTVTMVHVGSELCPPCQKMEPHLEELREKYENRIHLSYLDMQKHMDQAEHLGVRSTPTQIFYDHEGQERYRMEQFMDKQDMSEILEELLQEQPNAAGS